VSFDAACILAAFDLPQLLMGSACLALRWRSLAAFNSIDKLHKMRMIRLLYYWLSVLHLDTLGGWTVENWMKINPSKSKAIRFTRARG